MKQPKLKLLAFQATDELHRAVKQIAAKRGISVRDLLTEAVTKIVAQSERSAKCAK